MQAAVAGQHHCSTTCGKPNPSGECLEHCARLTRLGQIVHVIRSLSYLTEHHKPSGRCRIVSPAG